MAKNVTPQTKTPTLDHNEIARRAYQIYRARGNKPGSAADDWLKAEKELKAEAQKPVKGKSASSSNGSSRSASAR